jgi:hypothetical protein
MIDQSVDERQANKIVAATFGYALVQWPSRDVNFAKFLCSCMFEACGVKAECTARAELRARALCFAPGPALLQASWYEEAATGEAVLL